MKVRMVMDGWYRMGKFEIERVEHEWLGETEMVWNVIEDGLTIKTFDTLSDCKEWIIKIFGNTK